MELGTIRAMGILKMSEEEKNKRVERKMQPTLQLVHIYTANLREVDLNVNWDPGF